MTAPGRGTLYVVATPIGNLEDLTFRAARVLREVDVIAAEDTRRTAKLLARYEIRKPLISIREQNEYRESIRLIDRIHAGQNAAFVSDAGTPGISDPGAELVRLARLRDTPIVPIPGASAVAAALSISGVTASEFVFMGFPPASGRAREEWFERLRAEDRTVIFFEAPHRIGRTARELGRLDGREIQLHREITKINESLVILPITAETELTERGEFTIVVSPMTRIDELHIVDTKLVIDLFGRLIDIGGFDEGHVVKMVAAGLDYEPRAVAKIIKKHKISVKQQNDASA
jgi:16S rRNA (cytidine1402-2'-O)-methyltransferase